MINKRLVRQYALKKLDAYPPPKKMIAQSFWDHIEAEVRKAVLRRRDFHDNRVGNRKTLV